MKLMELINENLGVKYEYGCVMLYFNLPEIKFIHKLINPNHLYTEDNDQSYGLETEPHTTLLYGLHNDVTIGDVENIVSNFSFSVCKSHNPSLFQNEKYDVLKLDVLGDNLHEANRELKKLPHTNSFPNYHPHLTISYLKSGYGDKYVRKLGKIQYTLKPTHLVFSQPNGTKTKIQIKN
jgi:hypothetical protein